MFLSANSVFGALLPDVSAAAREDAYRANNVGVALLEQFDHKAAADQFRRALSLDPQLKIAQVNLAIALFYSPDLDAARETAEKCARESPEYPQSIYILGLIARSQNRTDDAILNFKKILQIDPQDVGANVNIGQIYAQQRKYDEAAIAFRAAIAAEPYNATALYNLANTLIRVGQREEGQKLIARFQELRATGAATSIGQNYLEQGRYAEALASTGAETDLVDKRSPQVSFQPRAVGLPNRKSSAGFGGASLKAFKSASKYDILRRFAGGATLIDFDNDGDLDLVVLNNSIGPTRKLSRAESTANVTASISLFRNDNGKFVDVTAASGDLAKITKNVQTGVVAGDFDNDNLPDLLVTGDGGLRLFHNLGNGKFEDVTVKSKLPKYDHLTISAAFVDADQDGDLDIFIAGFTTLDSRAEVNDYTFPREFSGAPNLLLRNNGDSTFTDISDAAKVNQSKPKNGAGGKSIAVIPTDFDNRRDVDFLVLNYGERPTLLRNTRDGAFLDVAEEVGLTKSANWSCAAVGDFNKDGFVDFFFGRADDVGVFAISDGRGKFKLQNAPAGTNKAAAAQFVDFDNDGLLDLIVKTDKGFVAARNLGDGWTNADAALFKINPVAVSDTKQMLAGDLDRDGSVDLLAVAPNGGAQFLANYNRSQNKSVAVALKGRVSNHTGVGVRVDLRAGSLTQKLESYAASPAPAPSEVYFGLGQRAKPDAVRIIWPSGIVQSETEIFAAPSKPVGLARAPLRIEELDRKPSSCPYLYTWNGERFEFITDFLGGGEMGNWETAGVYHYPDSNEFVRVTADQLRPHDGKYELRVTNELEEVLYLDYLKLVAVEHDADAEVYPNEGLGIPNAAQQILYTTHDEHAPLSAVAADGENVRPKIEKLDRRFYDNFKSLNIRGYADTHALTLNLDDKKGYRGRTLLLLTGWTDYAFSSDDLAASQSGKSLFLPRLEVKNRRGEWQTVIDSIGIPIGRPQTLVVDLTGKFLTDSREVRIVTNFKTFWDKIAVDTSAPTVVKTTELSPNTADLRERGFSREIKFGEMIATDYDHVERDDRWKHFRGDFTRLGDVKPLLNAVDDVFMIAASGDELALTFDALPAPPPGKKYTFLLYGDGYSKEMDINSGSPDTVLPLPFKQMTKYPYDANEHFPMTPEKQRIYDEYTTRAIKNSIPRLH